MKQGTHWLKDSASPVLINKTKKKNVFPLNKTKKNVFFLCFLVAYSYLCRKETLQRTKQSNETDHFSYWRHWIYR